jgi:ElaB/YqjD/DUF883 family membrane-anchored ribosome-binding protein
MSVASTASSAYNTASAKISAVRDELNHLGDEVQTRAAALRKDGRKAADILGGNIRKQPVTAVAAAFVAGALVATLFTRRH